MKYIKTFESQKGISFMDWLLQKYPDKNEWKNIIKINCSHENLVNLDGIENLVNLKYLYCPNNQLTELNIENLVNLVYLDCSYNQLTELNLENLINLKMLECYDNKLPYDDLYEYEEWFEKTYPEKVAAKRYNL